MERYIRISTAGITEQLIKVELPEPIHTAVPGRIGAAFGAVCSAFTYDKVLDVYDLLLTLIRVTIDTAQFDVYDAMGQVERGRIRAHEKHGYNSIEEKRGDDTLFWLACLGEEFGELCEAVTVEDYESEAVDLMTVATAWAAALDRPE